jgi:hypothetical protein
MRTRPSRGDHSREDRRVRRRTLWTVALSVIGTAAACAGTVVGLFGPSTLARAWDETSHDRAACSALATLRSQANRAIRLGEANTDETYAYWAYSWATARTDEHYTHSGSSQMQTYVLKVQNSIAHLNAICASWGLR